MTSCARCGLEHITRFGHPACTGHKDGAPCKNPPRRGGVVCGHHGGAAPQVRAKAAERVAEQAAAKQLAKLGQPVPINPADALLDLVHWTAGEVQYWRARVVAIANADETDLTWGTTSSVHKASGQWPGTDTTSSSGPTVAYAMLTDASNRLADYCTRAIKAGVEERRVRLEEERGALLVELIRRIAEGLWRALLAAGLSEDQFRAVWAAAITEVVPREIRSIGGGA